MMQFLKTYLLREYLMSNSLLLIFTIVSIIFAEQDFRNVIIDITRGEDRQKRASPSRS